MDEAKTAQTEVDVIINVTEAPAAEECAPKLSFGPDGAINDPALLNIIQRENPLGPIDVLKLAQFFSNLPTNAFLVEFLRASALMTMLTYPQLKSDVKILFHLDIDETQDRNEDWPFFEFFTDDENTEDSGDHKIYFLKTDILASTNQASTDDVGLVIQSEIVSKEKTLYFVIGVSPDPANLPLAGLKRHKSREVYASHTKSK